MISLFRLGAAAVIAGTALPLLRVDDWWVRALDFPRAHLAAVGAILLVRGPRRPRTFADELLGWGLGAAVAYQLHRIRPYTCLHAKEVVPVPGTARGEPAWSILVANVRRSNRRAAGLLRSVRTRRPDLVLILEADSWWEGRLAGLEEDYPYVIRQPQDNTYGMLAFSRLELISPRVEFLVQPDVPSMHATVRLPSGQSCALHLLHPRPPSPWGKDTTTDRDAELVLVGRRVRDQDLPTVVAGDLNDVAWSTTTTLFQRVSRLLDPRKGRGLYNTYNARIPFLRFPVDHVFHSEHFALERLERLPAFGSDHFPILVRLRLCHAARTRQSPPELDRAAREQAQAQLERASRR